MELNNKGITLVEIIVSVALISVVLIFLFYMLIQVNNENADNELRSSYLVNQASFIKQIEEDFIDYKLESITNECDIEKNSGETTKDTLYLANINNTSEVKCLKFIYEDSLIDYGYLFLYQREVNENLLPTLSYYRGDGFRQSVELEDYTWDESTSATSDTDTFSDCSLFTASIPIIGPDNNDYSINLSYSNC